MAEVIGLLGGRYSETDGIVEVSTLFIFNFKRALTNLLRIIDITLSHYGDAFQCVL